MMIGLYLYTYSLFGMLLGRLGGREVLKKGVITYDEQKSCYSWIHPSNLDSRCHRDKKLAHRRQEFFGIRHFLIFPRVLVNDDDDQWGIVYLFF